MKDKIMQEKWLDFIGSWSGETAIRPDGPARVVIGYCMNDITYPTLEELFWAWYKKENEELLNARRTTTDKN